MSRKEVYCRICDSPQPVIEHEPREGEPWYQIICGTCSSNIATIPIGPNAKAIESVSIERISRRCRGLPIGDGNYKGCAYGDGSLAAFEGPRDCPVCGGSGLEWLKRIKG